MTDAFHYYSEIRSQFNRPLSFVN